MLVACGGEKIEPTPTPSSSPENEIVFEDFDYELKIEPTNTWIIENAEIYANSTTKEIVIKKRPEVKDVVLKKEALNLIDGYNYQLVFDIKASQDKEIRLVIDDGNEHILFEESYYINAEYQHIELAFAMEYYDSWNANIRFYLGDNSEDVTFNINNLLLTSDKENVKGIKTNHLGYLINHNKTVTFSFNQGNYYNIYNENDEIVATYPIGNGFDDIRSGEYNFQGDFSDLNIPGTYYIVSEMGFKSHPFVIGDNLYEELLDASLRFIFLQRCGTQISKEMSNAFAHEICHQDASLVYGHGNYLDVQGGWHDAGDYGRYVQTTAKVLADLILAYKTNPTVFDDEMYLGASGNGTSDILDEIRYGLEWMMKLQKSDGSVYNKVTSEKFAGEVMPEDDKERTYILPSWTLTTASFAGVMANAALIYQSVDNDFSQRCYDAALKAGENLKVYRDIIVYNNPGEFSTGEYLDDNENDERFYAYASLYALTNDESYLNLAKEIWYANNFPSTFTIANLKMHGVYTLLSCDLEITFKNDLLQDLMAQANASYHKSLNSSYHYPFDGYSWGSNSFVADDISLQMMAYHFTKQERFVETALNELAYLLGMNPLDITFVTGFGYNSPQHIHHRITMHQNENEIGALVGGVDQYMSDGNLSAYLSEDTPIAKRYVDKEDSFSTNEVAIFYNSALVLALSFMVNV